MFENQQDELQKCAWRLVRSAEDRFGTMKGSDKLTWCLNRMSEGYPKKNLSELEDHVRAAYVLFKTEKAALKSYQI